MKKRADLLQTEIAHGKWLSDHDPIRQWGWGTPAGRLRAKRRAALIIRAGGLRPGSRVLEIGCGTGMFTEWFSQTGAGILAVDLSADLLVLARERRLPPDRVAFLERPFEECGGLGPFDAIVGSSVLHHLECPAALARIFQMLRPGGRLGFCEPNRLNPQVWFCLKFRRYFPEYSPEEGAFVRWALAGQLAAAGFSDIAITPFDWLHPAIPRPLIRTVKAAEWVCERTPGIREFAGSLCIAAVRPL
jgi:SAM-dependent methyltransferase